MAENKRGFFNRGWAKYLLPGIVLQSVLIGGGYATGREIIEYGAKFGANGWISGLFIFLAFGIIAVLTFELARIYKIYDYKSIVRTIAGPLWIVYDVIYFILLFLIISVMASATGEILQQTIGLNYWIGVIALIIIAGLLNFYGQPGGGKIRNLRHHHPVRGLYRLYGSGHCRPPYADRPGIRHPRHQLRARRGRIDRGGWGILYASYNLSAIPPGCLPCAVRPPVKRPSFPALSARL